MTNVNDIIWIKELVRCTLSSFWKKTRKNKDHLLSLNSDVKVNLVMVKTNHVF